MCEPNEAQHSCDCSKRDAERDLVPIDLGASNSVHGTYHFQVSANSANIASIRLFSTGGEYAAATNESTSSFTIKATILAQVCTHFMPPWKARPAISSERRPTGHVSCTKGRMALGRKASFSQGALQAEAQTLLFSFLVSA